MKIVPGWLGGDWVDKKHAAVADFFTQSAGSVPVYMAVIDVVSTTTTVPETPQFHTFMNQVPAGRLLATVTVQAGMRAMSNKGGTGGLAVGTPDELTTLHDRLDKFSKEVNFATIVTA